MKNRSGGKKIRYRESRNGIVLFLLAVNLVLSFGVPAHAQDDKYSFRLRGMGPGLHGIIDDLYSDLSLNPAFIHRYKGNWLYTNLSNLQGGDDVQIFNEQLTVLRNTDVYPNNLIGTITDRFGGVPFGIFLETRGRNITTDDLSENEQFLTATTGTLNRNLQVIETDNSGQSLSFVGLFRDIGFAVSLHLNDFNLQLEDESTSSAFSLSDTAETRSNTSFVSNTTVRSFDFPNSMIGFSIGKLFRSDNQEISIAAGLRPERMAFQANEILSLFKDSFLSGITDKFNILENQDIGFIEMGLRSVYVNARLKKIYPSLTQLRQNTFLFNYTRFSLPFEVETIESSIQDSLAVAGANRKTVILTRNGRSMADGDGTINRIEIGAGMERHFNNQNTLFAFGAKLDYIWGNLDITFNPGRIRENLDIDVEIGDPAEEAESFQRIITDNKSGFIKNDVQGAFLSLPVGLETKVSSKLTLRLGARPIIPVNFKTELESREIDETDELLETSENQTTFEPEDGLGHSATKKMEIDGKNLNYNSYHFGASYKFNDAVTIDFLHFSKITELDTWWLSLVLKY